jgi:RNA polymerase sigma factor (sigma-70 family)
LPLAGVGSNMMAVMEDRTLLEDYCARQSQVAFTHLVERHLPLVYSTALRITKQPAMAEDVAQAVFVALARQAGRVRDPAALPGWLYRAACHTAYNTLRAERRRRTNETAAMQITDMPQPAAAWERLAPLLDEAMAQLNAIDQNMVVQRFFEGRSLREVGAAFGLSDDAAQKRIHRALEKLRNYFAKNGVALPAVALIPAISEHAIHPPPAHLTANITALTSTVATTGGSFTFLQLLALMSQTKIKTSLVVVVLLVLASTLALHPWTEETPVANNSNAGSRVNAPASVAPINTPPKIIESPARPPAAVAFNTSAATRPLPASTAFPQAAGSQLVTAHAQPMRALVTALVMDLNKRNSSIPLDPVAWLNSATATADPNHVLKLDHIYGHLDSTSYRNLPHPERVVLLAESSFLLPEGGWGRTYGFADGHVEFAKSPDNDFTVWEAEHTDVDVP